LPIGVGTKYNEVFALVIQSAYQLRQQAFDP
jgi:hypothetical protein